MPNPIRKLTSTELHLIHAEIEDMIAFADYLEQSFVEYNDNNVFSLIVRQAIERFKINQEDLAKKFGVNRATISRWKLGKNAPQPMARPLIINWIQEQVRSEVKLLRENI